MIFVLWQVKTEFLWQFDQRAKANRQIVIANQVGGDDDPVFGSTTNKALMITELNVETWPKMRKTELAEKLADRIEAEFSE